VHTGFWWGDLSERDHLEDVGVDFVQGAEALSGQGPPQYRGFTITLRHTTLGRTPLDE
jgi:hypothetical protein